MKTQMEALIYHFKIVTEGFAVPPARSTRRSNRHAARWAITWSATARRSPIACTCAIPSFATLQALDKMCVGRLLADVVAVIGSIDIVLGEIDR